jgi:hypothetical protein
MAKLEDVHLTVLLFKDHFEDARVTIHVKNGRVSGGFVGKEHSDGQKNDR